MNRVDETNEGSAAGGAKQADANELKGKSPAELLRALGIAAGASVLEAFAAAVAVNDTTKPILVLSGPAESKKTEVARVVLGFSSCFISLEEMGEDPAIFESINLKGGGENMVVHMDLVQDDDSRDEFAKAMQAVLHSEGGVRFLCVIAESPYVLPQEHAARVCHVALQPVEESPVEAG